MPIERNLSLPNRSSAAKLVSKAWITVLVAWRNVVRQGRRSRLGILAVAIGTTSLLFAGGFFEWNYEAMREATIRSRIGHVQLMFDGYLERGVADPHRYVLPAKLAELADISRDPRVDVLAPRLAFNGLVSKDDTTASFSAEGVDPVAEQSLSGALTITGGANLSSIKGREVIIGRGLAENLKARVGDTVVLLVKTRTGGVNAVEVRVAGIFVTVTKAYDDYALRVPLDTARELLHMEGAHAWLVLLKATDDTDAFVSDWSPKLTTPALTLLPWHKTPVADFYKKTVQLFSTQFLALEILIGTIIVLSIANTMMNNVRERISEIGTTMALGDPAARVLWNFLLEGLFLGLVGVGIGLPAGIALALLVSWVGIPMPPAPGMTEGYSAGITLTWSLLRDATLVTVVTAFIAGAVPAFKASRMNIVDALRDAH